jgi:hypothetical protein
MIKLTVRELLEVTQTGAFGRFLAIPKPVAVSWANRKAGSSADAELKAFDERKQALLKEYGATLPDGAREYAFPEGAKEKFIPAMDELLAQAVDIEAQPVKVSDLRGDLSEADLSRLEKFVTD